MMATISGASLTRIGDGPVATVYMGHYVGRPVALKVLPKKLDKRTLSTYQKEQAKLTQLRRVPSILPVDGIDELETGEPALRMELCTQSLAALVERVGPLGAEDVVVLAAAVGTALAAAHTAGIVHGGMSPHNVLFRESSPVLADFGVTLRHAYARDPLHAIEFLPPETLRTGELNESTDLYGLGAVLHYALTGRSPHPGRLGEQPGERVLRILGEPVPAINAPNVPVKLSTLVARLLAADPTNRPNDSTAVAGLLISMQPDQQPSQQVDSFDDFDAPAPPPPPPPGRPTYVPQDDDDFDDFSGPPVTTQWPPAPRYQEVRRQPPPPVQQPLAYPPQPQPRRAAPTAQPPRPPVDQRFHEAFHQQPRPAPTRPTPPADQVLQSTPSHPPVPPAPPIEPPLPTPTAQQVPPVRQAPPAEMARPAQPDTQFERMFQQVQPSAQDTPEQLPPVSPTPPVEQPAQPVALSTPAQPSIPPASPDAQFERMFQQPVQGTPERQSESPAPSAPPVEQPPMPPAPPVEQVLKQPAQPVVQNVLDQPAVPPAPPAERSFHQPRVTPPGPPPIEETPAARPATPVEQSARPTPAAPPIEQAFQLPIQPSVTPTPLAPSVDRPFQPFEQSSPEPIRPADQSVVQRPPGQPSVTPPGPSPVEEAPAVQPVAQFEQVFHQPVGPQVDQPPPAPVPTPPAQPEFVNTPQRQPMAPPVEHVSPEASSRTDQAFRPAEPAAPAPFDESADDVWLVESNVGGLGDPPNSGEFVDFAPEARQPERLTAAYFPPPVEEQRRRIRYDLLAGAGLVLALLALIPLLFLRSDPEELRTTPQLPEVGSGQPGDVEIVLDPPVDLTDKVELKWRANAPELNFAVVIAAEGQGGPTVRMAERNMTMTVDVRPGVQYCFLVQATDDSPDAGVYESDPRGVRGARCKQG